MITRKTGTIVLAGAVLAAMLILSMAFVVAVNAQGQDSGEKPVLDNKDPLLYDAQIYASNNNVSTEEALRRFQLQNIPMPEEELKTKEVETFAGWAQGKYIVENEEVRDISGENVSLKDFLRRVEDAIPPQDAVTPTAQASPGAPGFGFILTVTSLLVVTMRRRKK